MRISDLRPKILFISTFPPRKCGIASFTEDLVDAIIPELIGLAQIHVCALDISGTRKLYPEPVSLMMDSFDRDSCFRTANLISNDPLIKLICIEHEFGLYGGKYGDYLLDFLALIDKPFIIRFHTVLPYPETGRLKIVRKISTLAEKVIVMTKHSARLLEYEYNIDRKKIAIIPHGTHPNSKINPIELKRRYQLKDKIVLTSFGLLSPNKGIEKGILAMKKISAAFPDTVYLVLGQTHPNLLSSEGEKYREFLQQIIHENDLQENVRLINEYLPTHKLMEYLALTDIYLFTSKDPNQAVSGTFLYAMSAGCPIISNSFVLAKEMLDEETGIIIDPRNQNELAESAIKLLENENLRKRMGYNAFIKTRAASWDKVAASHARIFIDYLRKPFLLPEFSDVRFNYSVK